MNTVGPRGVMKALPLDQTKREFALGAIDRLLSGRPFTKTELFGSHNTDRDRTWESRFFRRLVDEGAANVSGSSTQERVYSLRDRLAAARFKTLLQEENLEIRKRGLGSVFPEIPALRPLFDGLLLGDGHCSKIISGGLSCCFQMSQRHDRLAWLESVEKEMSKAGIESSIIFRPAQSRVLPNGKMLDGKPSYLLRTKCYRNLRALRLRWYPAGKKIVPPDLDLENAVLLAQWYMGDGGITDANGAISLSTCCFSVAEVNWLSEELGKKHGLLASVQASGRYPSLFMYGRHAAKFLEIVRPNMVSCFDYKLKLEWNPPICVSCGQVIDTRIGHAKYCDDCCSPKAWRERVMNGLAPTEATV